MELALMGDKHLSSAAWKRQRLIVLRRDCYICAYCGQAANEVDHVQPRVQGGTDDLDNLVACCRMCNLRKGKRSEALFLGMASTPPVFPSFLSPTRSEIAQDSPFTARPNPDQS
jgi:5-methylcytosine-specific restriction endonuclease McrA